MNLVLELGIEPRKIHRYTGHDGVTTIVYDDGTVFTVPYPVQQVEVALLGAGYFLLRS